MPKDIGVHQSPVFVLSTGRSGSTLVQRVLNCHRDLVLWGEHFGFLASPLAALAQMHDSAQRQFPRTAADNRGWSRLLPGFHDPKAHIEWANPYSAEEYATQLRAFVEAYFAGCIPAGRRWGFKEIRYNTAPVLRGLRLLYPQARFVFVTRDPVEVTRSKVYAFVKESRWDGLPDAQRRRRIEVMLRELRAHSRAFDDFISTESEVAVIVGYEALINDPERVIYGLIDHLRLSPAQFDCQLAGQVMSEVITSTPRDDALVRLIREIGAAI